MPASRSVQPKSFPTQADAILQFYQSLRPDFQLPPGIAVMNPYADKAAWPLTKIFYEKFYADSRSRTYIFGINPGRFGAGVTGVPFTDPIRLQEKCGIPNEWKKKAELSSIFIYELIAAYGGVEAFYGDFFFTALSPLGYTKDDRNLNYYDDKELLRSCEPFMLDCIRRQMSTIPTLSVCYCLGEGENYKQFTRLNKQYSFFEEIIPLPHPRWVMQYRRKKIAEYISLYVDKLKRNATH
jgi:uracil DNA glycosylase superfamily protein